MNDKLKESCKVIKKAYGRFPLFLLITTFTSIFLAVVVDTNLILEENLKRIMNFIILLASGVLLIESKRTKADFKKIFLCLFSAIISGFLTDLYITNSSINYLVKRVEVSFILVCILLSIYNLYKTSNKNFNEYVTKVFINIFKVSIVNVILTIGIAIISWIINYLLLETNMLMYRLELIVLGLYYISNIFNSFVNLENKESKFFSALIKYVLFGLLLLLYIIVYLYLLKILIWRNIPQNEVFEILSFLFFIGFPIWTMVSFVKQNKINKLLPILFIPLIILQIYALGIRVLEYGITPQRYIGIMLIILEIIYEIFYILKKNKIPYILIITSLSIVLSTIIPQVNMYDVSNYSQYKRLKIYKEKNNLSNEDKDKIYSAFNYLKSSDNGEKYINKILSYNNIKEIKGFNLYSNERYKTINASNDIYMLNVENYNKVEIVHLEKYNINKDVNSTFKNIRINDCRVDMTSTINSYIKNQDLINIYFKNHYEIDIDYNSKLIIEYFSLDMDLDNVTYYVIDGYLLRK